jgi:hypothetical protein
MTCNPALHSHQFPHTVRQTSNQPSLIDNWDFYRATYVSTILKLYTNQLHTNQNTTDTLTVSTQSISWPMLSCSIYPVFFRYRTSMWISMNRCRIYHAFIKLSLGDAGKWGKLTTHHTVSNLIPSTQNPINESTRSFTETVVWDLRFVQWWQDLSSWM